MGSPWRTHGEFIWPKPHGKLMDFSHEIFMGYFFEGLAGEGASNESGVVEIGDFRFIRSLSSEHFAYMATRQLSGDNCQ